MNGIIRFLFGKKEEAESEVLRYQALGVINVIGVCNATDLIIEGLGGRNPSKVGDELVATKISCFVQDACKKPSLHPFMLMEEEVRSLRKW